MNERAFAACAAAALTFTLTAHSFAFCVTTTCDPETAIPKCTFQGICNVSGTRLFWPSSCVSFDVQQDGSKKLNIPYEVVHSVVVNAFEKWTSAVCPGTGGMHPKILPTDFGKVACGKPEYNKTQPNANVIAFHDASPWPHPNALDTLALTTVFFNGDTGEIYDANVEINSADDNFSLGATDGPFPDLNAVLTHEIGHFLGLSHSDVDTSTMFSTYNADMVDLSQDDVMGICAALAPDRTTAGSDCTPRHGFSGACGKPETGCCATAIGSSASQNQTLGLFAFGLGLCAWTARFRFRRSGSARALRR